MPCVFVCVCPESPGSSSRMDELGGRVCSGLECQRRPARVPRVLRQPRSQQRFSQVTVCTSHDLGLPTPLHHLPGLTGLSLADFSQTTVPDMEVMEVEDAIMIICSAPRTVFARLKGRDTGEGADCFGVHPASCYCIPNFPFKLIHSCLRGWSLISRNSCGHTS